MFDHLNAAIFTDLDGTLIDFDSYSSELTKPYVAQLIELGYLVVFCSSKTFSEQRVLQRELGIEMPCIVENGSAIVAPVGFWKGVAPDLLVEDGWERVELGEPAREIRARVSRVEAKYGQSLLGFNSILAEDVASRTGLDLFAARRAQNREYSETLAIELSEETWQTLDPLFAAESLKRLPGGRFNTVISADTDKGAAIRVFHQLWKARSLETLISYGLGDSENDRELLENVDWPHLVKRPNGSWADIHSGRIERVAGVGPAGWVEVARQILQKV